MTWRLERSELYFREQKKYIGKDGNLRERVKKKVAKIIADPERVGSHKTGKLKGFYVILFEVVEDEDNPPGKVVLRYFWHHNDPRYDP